MPIDRFDEVHLLAVKAVDNIFQVPRTMEWRSAVILLMGEKFWSSQWQSASDEDIERLKMLAGPHGHAIWKAMEAKRGKNK